MMRRSTAAAIKPPLAGQLALSFFTTTATLMRRLTASSAIQPPLSGQVAQLSFRCLSSISSLSAQAHDNNNCNNIFPELYSLLAQPNWQKSPSLGTLTPVISSTHFSNFLLEYPNLNPRTALNFFQTLSTIPSFKPNIQVHASLLYISIQNELLDPAVVEIWKLMYKACESSEDAKFVLDFLRRMGYLGVDRNGVASNKKLSVWCYNNLLMLLSCFSLIDDMEYVYAMMLRDMVSPDIRTFNTMMLGYFYLGKVDKAEVFLSKIFRTGLNAYSYTHLLVGYWHTKNIDGAIRVFSSMPQNGCPRNELSYNILIHGLGEAGRLEEAMELFEQMGEENVSPNATTYAALILACCRLGRRVEAHKLVDEMVEKGLELDIDAHALLIDVMCKDGKLEEARSHLNLVLEKGLVPTKSAYNALIFGYCKTGMIDAAFEILEVMKSNNCNPDPLTYGGLILGFCMAKKVYKALAVFNKMLELKLCPLLSSFKRLVHALDKEGQLDDAFGNEGTYGALIVPLCEGGKVEEAHGMFSILDEKGIRANEVIYTSLIEGYSKVGKFDVAITLMERMLTEGFSPNLFISNVLRMSKLAITGETSFNGNSQSVESDNELVKADGSDIQVACFSEIVDDVTLRFQIIRLSKQIFAWIGSNSAKLGHLYAAAQNPPNNAVSVCPMTRETCDRTGSGIAHRLVVNSDLPMVVVACNTPKSNPMLEATAKKLLTQKLIGLGYTNQMPQSLS